MLLSFAFSFSPYKALIPFYIASSEKGGNTYYNFKVKFNEHLKHSLCYEMHFTADIVF